MSADAEKATMQDAGMIAVEMIAVERLRQIQAEGWTAEHDDAQVQSQIALAAAAYAFAAQFSAFGTDDWTDEKWAKACPDFWPWAPEWWKPSNDPVRNLVRAGALIAAEIDRLTRKRGD